MKQIIPFTWKLDMTPKSYRRQRERRSTRTRRCMGTGRAAGSRDPVDAENTVVQAAKQIVTPSQLPTRPFTGQIPAGKTGVYKQRRACRLSLTVV